MINGRRECLNLEIRMDRLETSGIIIIINDKEDGLLDDCGCLAIDVERLMERWKQVD